MHRKADKIELNRFIALLYILSTAAYLGAFEPPLRLKKSCLTIGHRKKIGKPGLAPLCKHWTEKICPLSES